MTYRPLPGMVLSVTLIVGAGPVGAVEAEIGTPVFDVPPAELLQKITHPEFRKELLTMAQDDQAGSDRKPGISRRHAGSVSGVAPGES